MFLTTPAPPVPPTTRPRRRRWLVAVALLFAAGVGGAQLLASGGITTSDGSDGGVPPLVTLSPSGGLGEAGGRLPEGGVRPDDDDVAGLAKLDPDVLDAVRRAETAAAEDGIEIRVTSGWRSRRYQQNLLDRAVVTYGSREEALRLVATPDRSRHVAGAAVDIGPTDAAYWMAQHGARFGLCQTFANEVWHYELLVEPGGTCPQMRADGSS
jgi:D-alanyl-D-alanine carboxypeptidase